MRFDCYYGLSDFEFRLCRYGGDDVADWVKANIHPLDIVFRPAEDHGVACGASHAESSASARA